MRESDEFDTRLYFGAATRCDIIFGRHNGSDRSHLFCALQKVYSIWNKIQ